MLKRCNHCIIPIGGDSRIEKAGGHCGAKEKVGVNVIVCPAW